MNTNIDAVSFMVTVKSIYSSLLYSRNVDRLKQNAIPKE